MSIDEQVKKASIGQRITAFGAMEFNGLATLFSAAMLPLDYVLKKLDKEKRPLAITYFHNEYVRNGNIAFTGYEDPFGKDKAARNTQ